MVYKNFTVNLRHIALLTQLPTMVQIVEQLGEVDIKLFAAADMDDFIRQTQLADAVVSEAGVLRCFTESNHHFCGIILSH